MLHQLGIDYTSIIQFFIFVLTFIVLVKFVYTPFADIQLERQKKTKGTVEVADEIQKKSVELHSQYSLKAREIHTKISEIYHKMKQEAGMECERIINSAKEESRNLVDINRKNIDSQTAQLTRGIQEQVPLVAQAITNKLLGK